MLKKFDICEIWLSISAKENNFILKRWYKGFYICEEPNKICEKRKAEKNNWKGLHFRMAADIIFL